MSTTPAFAAVAGLALAFVVGHDGAASWQVARVVLVVAVTLAVVVGPGRLRTRPAALLAIGFGLLAVGVGGGIGIPHAAKTGLHAETVAGVLALGAGLALVVVGTVVLVRASHGWARLGAATGVIVVAYVVLSTLGLAVAATNVPRGDLGSETPADRGLEYEDIAFAATDGVRLSGWYVPSRNGDAVVLLHGAGSTRSSVLDHAMVLAERGYGVLLFDARGHGRSAGRAMDFGWYGDRDVGGAVAFLDRRNDVTGRTLAVGMSMGGEEAIGAAASIPGLCGVVAEGATHRVASDTSWRSDGHGVRGWLREGLDRLTFGLVDVLTDASPPVSLRDAVAEVAPRKVLLIASRRVADEPDTARSIAAGAPGSADVWIVPGAGHTGALEARPGEWTQRVGDFLDAATC